MKISENTSVSMPIRNMLMIIGGVVAGVIAYTELTGRLTSLETSRELFEADLLKKSEQLPTDQEQYMFCLLYTSPSPRDGLLSRMPSSA